MKKQRPLWVAILLIWVSLFVGPLVEVVPSLIENHWQVIQDDARHFVAWLRALENPGLFQNDPIARFFSTVSPSIYKTLYWPAVIMGVDVVQWHLMVLLPSVLLLNIYALDRFIALFESDQRLRLAILLVCVGFSYGYFNNGLPRDFALFIVCMSMVAYLQNRIWSLCTLMLFGASMYPAAAMTSGFGLLIFELIRAFSERIRLKQFAVLALAALCGVVGLALFQDRVADLGQTMSLAEARSLPIFQSGGRTAYFDGDNIWETITCGRRAGLFANCPPSRFWWLAYPLHIFVIVGGSFILARKNNGDWRLLVGLSLGGLVLFATANIVAFEMHLPTRYARSSVQFVEFFLLTVIIFTGFERLVLTTNARRKLLPLVGAAFFLLHEPEKFYANEDLIHDPIPGISAVLRQTPEDTVVAGASQHIDNVPSFAGRSVWASLELSVPYKTDYYSEMSRRISILKVLFEETDPKRWQQIHVASGLDMYLLARYTKNDNWLGSFAEAPTENAPKIFKAYSKQVKMCTASKQNGMLLVDGNCFAKEISALW